MDIEEELARLAQMAEDHEWNEVRLRAQARDSKERILASIGRCRAEVDGMWEEIRAESELFVRDITGYVEEGQTGIPYYRPPKIISEQKLPHEPGYDPDPHNLYGHPEAAE